MYPIPLGIHAPVEQTIRAIIKNFMLNRGKPPACDIPYDRNRVGSNRVLPPFLGEMGTEIRHYVARAEPWIRNGWKVVTRRPALYPAGTTLASPAFFARADAILKRYGAHCSMGGIVVPPVNTKVTIPHFEINAKVMTYQGKIENLPKYMCEAMLEIELRQAFLEWFDADDRWINEYDRSVLSVASASPGNYEYVLGTALRPGFLPPTFEAPVLPYPPHVGVQIRDIRNHTNLESPKRNSDAPWMLAMADAVAAHLGVPVLVYGHPNGCFLPPGRALSWDAANAEDQMGRELGYLKSCVLMLAPDSGWADLMAWLEVPTLLEHLQRRAEFSCMRATFRPRMRLVDRDRPIEEQVDALLSAAGPVLPADDPPTYHVENRMFPWEP